eukprot:1174972-Rhodomonas_salina.1
MAMFLGRRRSATSESPLSICPRLDGWGIIAFPAKALLAVGFPRSRGISVLTMLAPTAATPRLQSKARVGRQRFMKQRGRIKEIWTCAELGKDD